MPTRILVLLSLVAASLIAVDAARAAEGDPVAEVTFARDVAPIFQRSCQRCHRPGTAAPMSLLTWEQSRPWARAIKKRVASRQMPPWQHRPLDR